MIESVRVYCGHVSRFGGGWGSHRPFDMLLLLQEPYGSEVEALHESLCLCPTRMPSLPRPQPAEEAVVWVAGVLYNFTDPGQAPPSINVLWTGEKPVVIFQLHVRLKCQVLSYSRCDLKLLNLSTGGPLVIRAQIPPKFIRRLTYV